MIFSAKETDYGTLRIMNMESILQQTVAAVHQAIVDKGSAISVGLTGGSTPKAFYKWAAETHALSSVMLERIYWFTSDERFVPLASDESNFGNAQRGMLDPLKVPDSQRFPWPIDSEPEACAAAFNAQWNDFLGLDQCFDVCFLGMGDDCHTASLFPGSPLINSSIEDNFAAIEVPGKGPRLTITEAGLSRCKQIVITVTGEGKAKALKQVLEGDYDPQKYPSQLLKACKNYTLWMVDEAAASLLSDRS